MNGPPPECKEQGLLAPIVDRNRCEGKEDCVRACPYGVFQIGTLTAEQRSGLSFKGRIKAWAHGGKQAFAVRAEECHGCGLCVEACPEDAIRLERRRR